MRIELKQGTDPWHDWRQHGVGGSEVAAVMNDSPYITKNRLLLEKQGKQEPKPFDPYLAKKGHAAEKIARNYVEGLLQTTLAPMCYQHDDYSYVRASLDGITPDETIIFEAKLVGAKLFDRISAEDYIPMHHYWQMQYGMCASGADEAIYAVVKNGTEQVYTVWLDKNENDISRLRASIDQFWADIKNNVDVEPDVIDMDRDNEFVISMASYFGIDEEIKSLLVRQEKIKHELISQGFGLSKKTAPEELHTPKKLQCRYGTISSHHQSGSLSYAKFVKDSNLTVPDEYRGNPTTVYRITKKRGKK